MKNRLNEKSPIHFHKLKGILKNTPCRNQYCKISFVFKGHFYNIDLYKGKSKKKIRKE